MKNLKYFKIIFLLTILALHSCNECKDISCENGGTCIDGECKCPDGYTGINCEIGDLCITQSVTCENGGTCIDGECDCPNGYTGINCEIEDLCITQSVSCENGGTCIDGECDCPDGYTGINCEQFDLENIQALLDNNVTPKELVVDGLDPELLFGKIYDGGYIFFYERTTCRGLVAALNDYNSRIKWGCYTQDITELPNIPWNNGFPSGFSVGLFAGSSNTDKIIEFECVEDILQVDYASKVCREVGQSWYLPSILELELMYYNLHQNGFGNFSSNYRYYWSSTEINANSAWEYNFIDGQLSMVNKNSEGLVRPIKAF